MEFIEIRNTQKENKKTWNRVMAPESICRIEINGVYIG